MQLQAYMMGVLYFAKDYVTAEELVQIVEAIRSKANNRSKHAQETITAYDTTSDTSEVESNTGFDVQAAQRLIDSFDSSTYLCRNGCLHRKVLQLLVLF